MLLPGSYYPEPSQVSTQSVQPTSMHAVESEASVVADNPIHQVISDRAQRTPNRRLVIEADGRAYTYSEFHNSVLDWCNALELLGCGPRTRVGIMLPTTAVPYLIQTACGWLNATCVIINPLLHGRTLNHAIVTSSIDILVGAPETLEAARHSAESVDDQTLVIALFDGKASSLITVPKRGADSVPDNLEWNRNLLKGSARARTPLPREETATIVFTSGTTGPAKPVRISAPALRGYGRGMFPRRYHPLPADSGYYSPWSPAHVLGTVALHIAVANGIQLVVRRKFSVDYFWSDINQFDCRYTVMVAVASMIWTSPAGENDADNPLELVGMAPLIPEYKAFARRFGVDVVSIYGMSELGPFLTIVNPEDHRITGSPSVGYECRLVNSSGEILPDDEVGELQVRPSVPVGDYDDLPTASDEAWRTGWFRTGDLFIRSGDQYRLVGRVKDSIRRRGRNISAYDVEIEVHGIRGVADCACIAVVGEDCHDPADEEIRIFVVPMKNQDLQPADIAAALANQLPDFMLPRYIDIVDFLPRTLSGKIQKSELRRTPVSAGTWDRKRRPSDTDNASTNEQSRVKGAGSLC